MRLPSQQSMEILAISDQGTFTSLMEHIGLPITGHIETDPLKSSQVQLETISAMASEITEDANHFVDVDQRLHAYKDLAEDYGYIVAFA